MNRHYHFLLPFLILLATCKSPTAALTGPAPETFVAPGETVAYVGTYTRPEGHVNGVAEGIYRVGINQGMGQIGSQMLVAEVTNPSFLKLSADKRILYAVSELAHDDEPTGFIHAFRTDGKELREISKLPTNGKAPCHIGLDRTGKFAVVSNYVGGTATVYAIDDQGRIQETDQFNVPADPDGKPSWLHSANFSPGNEIIAVADKGRDQIWLLTLDRSSGKFTPNRQAFIRFREGSGPRHAEWSADGRFLYVINELSNTVNVVGMDPATGKWTIQQTISTLPAGFAGESYCADIHLHPSGKFLFGSNRGHNSIARFGVNSQNGTLTTLGFEMTRGEYPRNFAISPNGKWLYVANQNTDNITTFLITEDGQLPYGGEQHAVATPVCIEW